MAADENNTGLPKGLALWRLALTAVALVAAGCLPAPGTDNAFYVLIPYIAGVFGTVMAARSVLDLAIGGEGRHTHTREEHLTRLARRLLVGAIGSAAAAVAELAHALLFGASSGFGYTTSSAASAQSTSIMHVLLYVTLTAGAAALLVWLYRDVRRERGSRVA